jgi:hypothetical protein
VFRASRHSLKSSRKLSKITIVVTGGTVLTAAVAVAVTTGLGTAAGQTPSSLTAAARPGGVAWPTAKSATRIPDIADQRRLAVDEISLVRQRLAAQAAAAQAAAAARQRAAEQAQQEAEQKAQQQQRQAEQQQAQAAPAPVVPSGTAQQIAESMLSSYGWSTSQFSCLESLWNEESGWNVTAENPSSGAYGIPQALPGSKMASAGPDWQTDATTQIAWGLGYIRAEYGSPCGAWSHEEADGWY